MPVPRWKCVFGTGLLTSFLHVFCLPSTLAIHILALSSRFCPSSRCLRPHTTRMKHLALAYWAAMLRENRHFSAAGWCRFLCQLSCFGGANETLTFFLLWAFMLPQCYMWDFTGIEKAKECGKTSAYRAAVLLNSMPNLFFKRDCFYCLPRETIPLAICFL